MKRNEGTVVRVGIGNADVRIGATLHRGVPVAGLDYAQLQAGDRVAVRWLGEKPSIQSLLDYKETAGGIPAGVAAAATQGDTVIVESRIDTLQLVDKDGGIADPDSNSQILMQAGAGISPTAAGNRVLFSHATGDIGDVHTNYTEHDQQEAVTDVWNFAAKLLVSDSNTLTSTSPWAVLEVKSDDTTHVRLSYDQDNYAELTAASDGTLNLTPSGPAVQIAANRDFISDGNLLWVDADENKVYINAGTPPSSEPAYRGALTVKPGAVTDKGLVIQGLENQNAYYLQVLDHSGNDLILMSLDGDLESGNPGFVSGLTGWQIAHTGDAEFNDLWCRGEFHCSIFVADEQHASGGTIVAKTAFKVAPAVSENDNTLPAVDSAFTLVAQASWDTGLSYIADNDVLRLKFMARDEGGTGLDLWDVYLEVNGVPSSNEDRDLANGNPGTFDVNCIRRKGGTTGLVIPSGTGGVVWCKVDQVSGYSGAVLLTSDLQYAPYLDIFTVDNTMTGSWGEDTPTITPRVRLGNLNGVLGLSEEWGIAASTDLSNASIDNYIILSDQQLTLKGVHQYWIDSTGNVRGELDPTAGDNDTLLWLGSSESAARFKVYGDGDLWLSMLAISEDAGQWLFSQSDGLALWGPGCEISPSTWVSTRGQKATISGAFHTEQGAWAGTRGLVIDTASTNTCTNPSFETNATGWTASSLGSIARTTEQAKFGSYSLKCTSGGGQDFAQACYTGVTLDPSRTYWVSGHYKLGTIPPGGNVVLRAYFSGGANPAAAREVVGGIASPGGWIRVMAPLQADYPDRTGVLFYLGVYGATADDQTMYIDGFQVESYVTTDRCTSYMDGDLDWCYWAGTPHASNSNRGANPTDVVVPASESLNPAVGSLVLNFKLLNPPGLTASFWLFAAGNANAIFDAYVSYLTKKIRLRINGAITLEGTTVIQPFEEYQVVFTWDVAANKAQIYLNGALEAEGACPAWTMGTSLWLGGTFASTTLRLHGTLSQAATTGRVLTADEIAAMYATSKPLTDAGAVTNPGLYILDGKVRIASSTTGNRLDLNNYSLAIGNGVTYNSGTGVWLGLDGGTTPKMFLGDSAADKMTWDGSSLDITGNVTADSGAIAGWTMIRNALYKLDSGTPTSTPKNGITIQTVGGTNSKPVIKVYDGTTMNAALGNYASGKYGIYAIEGAIGGWTINATDIYNTHMGMESDNERLWIHNSTFANAGIQLEYNGGSPRAHIGNGSTEYFKYTGSALDILTGGGALRFNSVGFQFKLGGLYTGDGASGIGVVWKTVFDDVTPANEKTQGYIRMVPQISPNKPYLELVSGSADNNYYCNIAMRTVTDSGTRTPIFIDGDAQRVSIYDTTPADATFSVLNPGNNEPTCSFQQIASDKAVLHLKHTHANVYYLNFEGGHTDRDGYNAVRVYLQGVGTRWIRLYDTND